MYHNLKQYFQPLFKTKTPRPINHPVPRTYKNTYCFGENVPSDLAVILYFIIYSQ